MACLVACWAFCATVCVKMATSRATPIVKPTWRMVLSEPEPTPRTSGGSEAMGAAAELSQQDEADGEARGAGRSRQPWPDAVVQAPGVGGDDQGDHGHHRQRHGGAQLGVSQHRDHEDDDHEEGAAHRHAYEHDRGAVSYTHLTLP